MISPATLTPVEQSGHVIGHQLKTSRSLVFFGTRYATLEALSAAYPQMTWVQMKQEHGDRLVRVPNAAEVCPRADAIWTPERDVGVIVSTADCMPVLIVCDQCVSAIHAGWRGVLNGVITRCLQSFRDQNSARLDNARAYIGPHIQQEHFDFNRADARPFFDLAKDLEIESGLAISNNAVNAQKVKISLKAFAHAQLRTGGFITPPNICEYLVDTYSHGDFHSHRCDRRTGRNLSFAARL